MRRKSKVCSYYETYYQQPNVVVPLFRCRQCACLTFERDFNDKKGSCNLCAMPMAKRMEFLRRDRLHPRETADVNEISLIEKILAACQKVEDDTT